MHINYSWRFSIHCLMSFCKFGNLLHFTLSYEHPNCFVRNLECCSIFIFPLAQLKNGANKDIIPSSFQVHSLFFSGNPVLWSLKASLAETFLRNIPIFVMLMYPVRTNIQIQPGLKAKLPLINLYVKSNNKLEIRNQLT